MAFCLAELHLWSTRSSLQVKDTDIGTYQYYDKGEPAIPLEHHYYDDKRHFTEARGYSWTPRNRRPEKLRHSLKELEELLQSHTCVQSRWRSKRCCQVLLSNGVLVTLTLKGPQLEQVHVDRTLVGRLPASTVTDAVLSDRLILMTFLEQNHVAGVFIRNQDEGTRRPEKPEKLSASDIKVVCVEVSGGGRRLRRRLSLNRLQDLALVWWDLDQAGDQVWTWTPNNTHRHNLVLISCSPADGLQVLCSLQTDGDPLDCSFSTLQPYQLLTVELPKNPKSPPSPGDACWADSCTYECTRGRLHRTAVTHITLPSLPLSVSRHPGETALLLGLSDSSLVLFDGRRGGAPLRAPCPVAPALLAWHPAGAVAAAAGEQGELMLFDAGLAPLGLALGAEDVAPGGPTTLRLDRHVRCCGRLERLQWTSGQEADVMMLEFHGGPMAALRFRLGCLSGGVMGHSELLQQRLRCDQLREALGVLEAMDWCIMGYECYRGLSSITNQLLRLDLNATTEALLEAALGVFYSPAAPLPDVVILEFREPISRLARRFFHHLLRHQRLEKAFLLAVDLEDRDLFMDLHYVACDKGELVLADVAKRKANETSAADDPPGGRDDVSSLCDRQTEITQNAPGPSYPETPTTQANQRRPQAESSSSHDVFRILRQTGRSRGDKDGRNTLPAFV